ncbi:CerR family C-terminal domain-containing protein [Thiocystis violacea]|uniref:CerR family C-terminal domain-containing protein n=1 Tax=Thiocystis violacea TaxID=13725 RepID=UPI0019059E07
MSSPPPTSETRDRLIEAGIRLFAEHGFKGVAVRDLCTEAEANIAAVNYHFGSKQGLYAAIFDTTLAADEARFREALATITALAERGRDEPSQLATAVNLYVRNLLGPLTGEERMRWFAVLAIREMAFPGDGFEQIYRRRAEPAQTALTRIVIAARQADTACETDCLQAHALLGMIWSFGIAKAILWKRLDWERYTPERIQTISDIITDLMCRALGIAPDRRPGERADTSTTG